ncbi:hypothetical protein ASG24_12375 [Methylophilus sp. Leaf414]|nr:hypothetical protein ASG24_12375 [Methylophilus sp. Leaf414]
MAFQKASRCVINLINKAKQFLAFTALSLGMLSTAQAKDWTFEVWLDKQKIGTHTFAFNNNQLQSRADFNVKVLFINAYRYTHQADETWQGTCLTSLKAHTEENKVVTDVNGQLQDKQFVVDKHSAKNSDQQTLPACTMTFAYWNPEILKQSRLLNPQNAEYLDVTVTDEGPKTIMVKGQSTQTRQYRLNGRLNGKDKLKITLWYDQQQAWVALESITPEGYKIVYKLV